MKTMMYMTHYASPIGDLMLESDGDALTGLCFDTGSDRPFDCFRDDLPVFAQTRQWLDSYFAGKAPDFIPPLRFSGTPFRQEVWEILLSIPYGKTLTYGEIAAQIAQKRGIRKMSAQAVGGAVSSNPIALISPCHRVVGSGGALTGYAGGLDRKAWLLEREGIAYPRPGKTERLVNR